MKKISLTTMILLALVLGMIIGVVLNNTASPETAKLYAQEISIFTTIFLRLIKMIIAPLVVSTLVVGIAKMGCIDSREVRKKPGGHWIIRDLAGLDLVGLASL